MAQRCQHGDTGGHSFILPSCHRWWRAERQGRLLCDVLVRVYENAAIPSVGARKRR
jgi:hypothetical protein